MRISITALILTSCLANAGEESSARYIIDPAVEKDRVNAPPEFICGTKAPKLEPSTFERLMQYLISGFTSSKNKVRD